MCCGRSSACPADGRFLRLSGRSREKTPFPGSSRRLRPALGADGNRARALGPGAGPLPGGPMGSTMRQAAVRRTTGHTSARLTGGWSRARSSAPTAHSFTIKRPRLTKLLDDSGARFLLLVAPAGYGKTTLAREWTDGREGVIWYSGGPAMADVAALAAGVAEALTSRDEVAERVRILAARGQPPRRAGQGRRSCGSDEHRLAPRHQRLSLRS